MREYKKLSCLLTTIRLDVDTTDRLWKQYPCYVGQSTDIASRWISYMKSAAYPGKKFGNCLDKVKGRSGYWVALRLLDWGIHKSSLDDLERCRIAQIRPTLNHLNYGLNLNYCDRPIRPTKTTKKVSGIYQIILIPKDAINLDTSKSVLIKSVYHHLQNTLLFNLERETLWIVTGRPNFTHYRGK